MTTTSTRYSLALSARHNYESFTTSLKDNLVEVEVNLQVTRRFSFVNDSTDHPSDVRKYRYDPATFLSDHSASTAFRDMFIDMLVEGSKCKFLVPYLSSFARHAVINAAQRRVPKLILLLGIGEDVVDGQHLPADGVSGEARGMPESCAVCLDSFSFSDHDDEEIFSTPCFHVFHRRCIQQWMNRGDSCPLCRLKM